MSRIMPVEEAMEVYDGDVHKDRGLAMERGTKKACRKGSDINCILRGGTAFTCTLDLVRGSRRLADVPRECRKCSVYRTFSIEE